jgi:alpha-beta hydrolase superfamily lysophospholipase
VTSPRRTAVRPAGFTERFAKVNGVRPRYPVGGQGSPVVLLHGYAETGHMWQPIMPVLAERHTVVVPDLRGAGGSAKPASGYDKKNMAADIHGTDRVTRDFAAADRKPSVPEADRRLYARAYAQSGAMRAGFE